MISEILENTKAKYVEKLQEAESKRDAEIEKRCADLRAELLAVPNNEIESLKKVIADLDALIEREKADEQPKAEAVAEPVTETIAEEPTEEIHADDPVEEIANDPEIVEKVEEPKVEVKEVKVEKPSLFQRLADMKKAEQPKIEIKKAEPKKVEEPKEEPKQEIVKIVKKPQGRVGMEGIFNPKRR